MSTVLRPKAPHQIHLNQPIETEGSIRSRFKRTLIDDAATKDKYYRWLADWHDAKSTYDDYYRGILRR